MRGIVRDFRDYELEKIAEDRQKLDEREARIRRELAVWDARAAFVQAALVFAGSLRTMWQTRPDLHPGEGVAARFVESADEVERLGAWDGLLSQAEKPKEA